MSQFQTFVVEKLAWWYELLIVVWYLNFLINSSQKCWYWLEPILKKDHILLGGFLLLASLFNSFPVIWLSILCCKFAICFHFLPWELKDPFYVFHLSILFPSFSWCVHWYKAINSGLWQVVIENLSQFCWMMLQIRYLEVRL